MPTELQDSLRVLQKLTGSMAVFLPEGLEFAMVQFYWRLVRVVPTGLSGAIFVRLVDSRVNARSDCSRMARPPQISERGIRIRRIT